MADEPQQQQRTGLTRRNALTLGGAGAVATAGVIIWSQSRGGPTPTAPPTGTATSTAPPGPTGTLLEHVWLMQLIEVDGVAVAGTDWQDVVQVKARSRTVVRIAFEGLTGKTVYHCHILDHEDSGMMGIIRTGP